QINEEPEPPTKRNPALPPAVDRAIAWMMQKDPAARPRTLSAAVSALQGDSLAQTTPMLTPLQMSAVAVATAPAQATLPPVKRSRLPWIGVGVAIALAAVGGGVVIATRDRAAPASPAKPAVVAAPAPAPTPPVAPAHPDRVIIEVKGAPEGTTMLIGGD